jgi:hypothetical protein
MIVLLIRSISESDVNDLCLNEFWRQIRDLSLFHLTARRADRSSSTNDDCLSFVGKIGCLATSDLKEKWKRVN